MKVFVSTSNFGSKSVPEVFDEIDSHTFQAIEISSGHPWKDRGEEVIARCVENYGLSVMFHNHAPPGPDNLFINLSEPDDDERRKVVDFLKSRIKFTQKLGSDYYSFHAGYRVPYKIGLRSYESSKRLPAQESLKIFIEATKEVVSYAEQLGVHVGVENHVVEPGNEENLILYNVQDYDDLLGAINSDYLHLHLDVGHLKVTGHTLGLDKTDFIRHLGPTVMATHLHENDGLSDAHGGFKEDFWFLEHLEYLSNLAYACLETDKQETSNINQMRTIIERSFKNIEARR